MRTESDWLLTHSGKAYWPLDPRPEDICIEDIAHGLSMLCRFAGQVSKFYSVGEHSVLVSHMVPPELALEALLHDASECYLSDICRPLKRMLPDYAKIEVRNMAAVRLRFGLPLGESPLVKQADTDILESEKVLLPPVPFCREWKTGGTLNPSVKIRCWSPMIAEIEFLKRFGQLIKQEHYATCR